MALSLKWVFHTACNVLGYQNDNKIECKNLVGFQNDHAKVVSSTPGSENMKPYSSSSSSGFQMPLHYPRYSKADYVKMEEWKLDMLLREYGLSFQGSLDEKRKYAMGAFLWPDQY